MGSSASSPVPLAPTFQRISSWELKDAKRILQDYKDKDLDFGLDAQALSELLAGDKGWAAEVIDAFGSTNGMYVRPLPSDGLCAAAICHELNDTAISMDSVNALAFICGVCMVCPGSALERAGLVFDALDFDATEQLSMDEMTIVFLCATRGFCVLSGVGAVPSDDDLESVTLSAYRELNKSSGQSISKAEFTKWVLRFAAGGDAGGDSAATTISRSSEVSLKCTLEQFGVVTPSKASSPVHEEFGDEATTGTGAGDEENNPIFEHQGVGAQQVEVDMMHGESSAFDAAYQAQDEEVAQTNAEEEENYTEGGSAAKFNASPEKAAATSEPETQVDDATPGNEESFGTPPVASAAEEKEEQGESYSDEAQEYEQEFAPETSRNADSLVATAEQTLDEDIAVAEEHESSAEHESDLITEEAVDTTPSTESFASPDEQAPVADPRHEEVSAPVSSEQTLEPEAVAETELPVLDADADYENDGYDLPSARNEDETAAAAVETVKTSTGSEVGGTQPPAELEEGIDKSTPVGDSGELIAAIATVDLNDFDAYDYEQPEYDASSGLPPPEDPADEASVADEAAATTLSVDEAPADEVPVDSVDEAPAAEEAPAEETPTRDEVPDDDGGAVTAENVTATDEAPTVEETPIADEIPANAVAEVDTSSASGDLPANGEAEENETANAIATEIPETDGAPTTTPEEQLAEEI